MTLRRFSIVATAPLGSQRGVSLIELMVAIAISMILLAAVASVITSTNEGYRELHRSNEQAENGRVALQLLSDDIMHAGFYGVEFPEPDKLPTPTVEANPCATAAAGDSPTPAPEDVVQNGLLLPIYGYDDVTTSSTLPSCIPVARLQDNTDIITIRRAGTIKTDTDNDNVIDAGELMAGAYYLQGDNTNYKIYRGSGSTATDTANFSLKKLSTTPTMAEIRPLRVYTYYVARCNICSGAGADTIPTLKRQELTVSGGVATMTETPLVEGIEQLQITYGVDTDPHDEANLDVNWGSANYYQTADNLDNNGSTSLATWKKVVSVRLDIVARNREATSGYQDAKSYTLTGYGAWSPAASVDNFKRRAYTMTLRTENITARRER